MARNTATQNTEGSPITYTASGSTAPTVLVGQNYLGVPCVSIAFASGVSNRTGASAQIGTYNYVPGQFLHSASIVLSRALTGSEALRVRLDGNQGLTNDIVINAANGATAWIRMCGTVGTFTGSSTDNFWVEPTSTLNSPVTVFITKTQLENVTGQSNQAPGEYQSVGVLAAPYQGAGVDGLGFYNTLNGNTVSGNVVTPGTGAPITNANSSYADARGPFGLLTEGLATNGFLQSQDFTTTWTNSNLQGGVVTSNVAVAPDGTMSADLVTPNNTSGLHFVAQSVTVPAAAGTFQISVYAKPNGYNFLTFRIDTGAGDGVWASFNVATGTVATQTTAAGTGWTGGTAVIEVDSNGFYRCTVPVNKPLTPVSIRSILCVMDVAGNPFTAYSYSGNTTSGMYFWQADQTSIGFPSTPIPTTTTAATRAADVLSYPSAGNISATSTSFAMQVVPTQSMGSTVVVHWGSYVDANNYTRLLSDGTNLILRKRIAGVNYDATIAWSRTALTVATIAGRWDGTYGVTAWLNGAQSASVAQGPELCTPAYSPWAGYDCTISGATASGFTCVAGTTQSRIYLNIATVIGSTYTLTFKNDSKTAGGVDVYARNASNMGGADYFGQVSCTVGTTYTVSFTATTTTSSLGFLNVTSASGFVMSGIHCFVAGNQNTSPAQLGSTFQIGSDGNGAQQDFCTHRLLNEYVKSLPDAKIITLDNGALFGTTNYIGIQGGQGFGVGIAPSLPAGMSGIGDYMNPASDNYGNYQYSDGSVMVWVPAFFYKWGTGSNGLAINAVDVKAINYYPDIATANAAGYALHRAFYDGGVVQQGVFVDKYLTSNNAGIASSIKLGNPLSCTSVHNPFAGLNGAPANNYYGAIAAAKTRGANFFCNSRFIFAALAMLSYAHAAASSSTTYCAWYNATNNFPKGCNNNALGDAQDAAILYTTDGYSNAAKTGSANLFSRTTHNGQNCGVADLNGNMWEITPGLSSNGTNLYILKTAAQMKVLTAGNTLATDLWGATGYAALYDDLGTTYGACWATGANRSPAYGSASQVFSEATTGNAWNFAGLGGPLVGGVGGTNAFGNDILHDYKPNEMCPFSGGSWNTSSGAGVWALGLVAARGSSNFDVGFRAALYL